MRQEMPLINCTMKHSNISLFVPHAGCPNQCSFCNQKTISGSVKELTKEEVRETLEFAKSSNLSAENTEIAFFGGSFTAIDRDYMISLLEEAKPFIDNGIFSGIRISTRPDAIDEKVLEILKEYKWTFSTSEVQEVFTVPLKYFLETDAQTYYNTVQNVPQEDFPFDKIEGGENYKWHKGKYPVHFYEYNGYVIWGLTARIMRSVAQLMNKIEHQLG